MLSSMKSPKALAFSIVIFGLSACNDGNNQVTDTSGVSPTIASSSSNTATASSSTQTDQSSNANVAARSAPDTFVGIIPADGSSISVTIEKKAEERDVADAFIYICDGISKSAWYYGFLVNDSLYAISKTGRVLRAKLIESGVTGEIELPGNTTITEFTAPRTTGFAGLYLATSDTSGTKARALSVMGSRQIDIAYDANLAGSSSGSAVTGNIVEGVLSSTDGISAEFQETGQPLDYQGMANIFGDKTAKSATWIVQPDGSIKGMTGGGVNCSFTAQYYAWKYGGPCRYYMLPPPKTGWS